MHHPFAILSDHSTVSGLRQQRMYDRMRALLSPTLKPSHVWLDSQCIICLLYFQTTALCQVSDSRGRMTECEPCSALPWSQAMCGSIPNASSACYTFRPQHCVRSQTAEGVWQNASPTVKPRWAQLDLPQDSLLSTQHLIFSPETLAIVNGPTVTPAHTVTGRYAFTDQNGTVTWISNIRQWYSHNSFFQPVVMKKWKYP